MPNELVTHCFAGSDILQGSGNIAVFRALLYFNLPHNIVFKTVQPVKVFSKQIFGYSGAYNQGKTLNDLLAALEGKQPAQMIRNIPNSKHQSTMPHLILLSVDVPFARNHGAEVTN